MGRAEVLEDSVEGSLLLVGLRQMPHECGSEHQTRLEFQKRTQVWAEKHGGRKEWCF